MIRLACLLLFVAGCVIKPMTAEDMYGKSVTENQGLRIDRTEKRLILEATANTEGRIHMKRDAATGQLTELVVELKSKDIDEITKAKGDLVAGMTESRVADLQRVLGQQKIVSDAATAQFNRLMDTVDKSVPLIAPISGGLKPKPPKPDPATPSPDEDATGTDMVKELLGPFFGPPTPE